MEMSNQPQQLPLLRNRNTCQPTMERVITKTDSNHPRMAMEEEEAEAGESNLSSRRLRHGRVTRANLGEGDIISEELRVEDRHLQAKQQESMVCPVDRVDIVDVTVETGVLFHGSLISIAGVCIRFQAYWRMVLDINLGLSNLFTVDYYVQFICEDCPSYFWHFPFVC